VADSRLPRRLPWPPARTTRWTRLLRRGVEPRPDRFTVAYEEATNQAGLLGTVFESIDVALVLLGREGTVRLHNAAARHMLGREKLASEPQQWLRRLPAEPTFTYGFHRDSTEDGLRILAVQLAPMEYDDAIDVVAIVRDVTIEQQRIEELSTFAAVAAHDLKTPLAAVQGWLEVAEDMLGTDPERARQALQRGYRAADRMALEIEDWLA